MASVQLNSRYAPQSTPLVAPPPVQNYQSRYGGGQISKEAYDLENVEAGKRQGLKPVAQTANSSGAYTTQYGADSGASMTGLRNTSSGGGSGGSGEDFRTYDLLKAELDKPTPTISRTSGPSAQQESAAREAAFNRAKDKSGKIAASSLRGLREALGSRGLLGGGAEGAGVAQLAGQTGEGLGDVVREQAVQEAGQASRNADTEYTGQVSQRGQDIARRQSLLSLINAGRGLY